MSLIDVSEYDEFFYAYKDLAYEMLEQNATDEEITDTLKEIIDEFITTKEFPDEENPEGYGRIYDTDDPDYLAARVIKTGWRNWGPIIISYMKKFYMDELEEIHGATLDEFVDQLISGMAAGVVEWESNERSYESPILEDDDPIIQELEEILKNADNYR